jgi:hypothetical protein
MKIPVSKIGAFGFTSSGVAAGVQPGNGVFAQGSMLAGAPKTYLEFYL